MEWIHRISADVEIRLINADGSQAEISGNGTRCVAAYISANAEGKNSFDTDRGGHEDLRLDFAAASPSTSLKLKWAKLRYRRSSSVENSRSGR